MMYRDFAKIYDTLMYDFDYDLVYKSIKDIYLSKNINPKEILELACGTGSLTEKIAKDYKVDAMDLSEDMLVVAQNKIGLNKNVRFFKQNMINLNMSKKYDSVLCICDSLNYILKEDDLDKVFKNVYTHLEEDGIFIFDLNTEKKFLDMDEIYIDETDDVFYIWENYYDEINKLNTYGVNFFINQNQDEELYKRVYEEHIERAYNIDFVKKSLKQNGFEDIEIYDDYNLDEINEYTHRIVVIARRNNGLYN